MRSTRTPVPERSTTPAAPLRATSQYRVTFSDMSRATALWVKAPTEM